jgi:hypothetical protein
MYLVLVHVYGSLGEVCTNAMALVSRFTTLALAPLLQLSDIGLASHWEVMLVRTQHRDEHFATALAIGISVV